MSKDCSHCGQIKELDAFYTNKKTGKPLAKCKECVRDLQRSYEKSNRAAVLRRKRLWAQRNPNYAKTWRARNPEAAKQLHLKRYNLSVAEFNAMVKCQGGRCAICDKVPRRLVVDHDHKTGKVRGLLCDACNHLLGNAYDRVETLSASIRYLQQS